MRLMLQAAELWAVVAPPMPAFYLQPKTLNDLVDHHVIRVLDLLRIEFADSRSSAGRVDMQRATAAQWS
jgi:4-hydroxy-3-polyprenylbenzoate decarboxylase